MGDGNIFDIINTLVMVANVFAVVYIGKTANKINQSMGERAEKLSKQQMIYSYAPWIWLDEFCIITDESAKNRIHYYRYSRNKRSLLIPDKPDPNIVEELEDEEYEALSQKCGKVYRTSIKNQEMILVNALNSQKKSNIILASCLSHVVIKSFGAPILSVEIVNFKLKYPDEPLLELSGSGDKIYRVIDAANPWEFDVGMVTYDSEGYDGGLQKISKCKNMSGKNALDPEYSHKFAQYINYDFFIATLKVETNSMNPPYTFEITVKVLDGIITQSTKKVEEQTDFAQKYCRVNEFNNVNVQNDEML